MISDATLKKLRKLSTTFAAVEVVSPLEEWKALVQAAEDLAGSFLQDGDSEAQEVATHIQEVAQTLSKGIIANPEAGVKAIQSLIGVLNDLDGGPGMVESHRKQAIAEAGLFFRDAKKEEALVNDATAFEDDDEKREMIMAIEQRIDELESDLLALDPPVSDADEVRSIFREFHTLKGEGAICGMKAVAEFCHGIETEIEGARSGTLILTNEIVSILQELTAIIRPILAGESREEIGEDLIEALMTELHEAVESAGAEAPAEAEAEEDAEGGEDKFADFFSGFEPPPEREIPDPEDLEPASDDASGPEDTAVIRQEEAKNLAESLSAADFLDSVFAGDEKKEDETADQSGTDDEALADLALQTQASTEAEEPVTALDEPETIDVADSVLSALESVLDEAAADTAAAPTATAPAEKPESAPSSAPAGKPAGAATAPEETVIVTPPTPPKKPPEKRKGDETVIESGDLAAITAAAITAADSSIIREAKKLAKSTGRDTTVAQKEIVEKKVEETKVKAISVDVNRLDDLLEIVGEVSLIGSYVTTQLQGQENLAFQTTNLLRACARLQEVANSMRMTSIRPLFMTIRRAAADAARASRKMIDINMRGIDTQVDRSIVESLSAALIHIIRNAVDHGIETTDVRRRAGKPERGSIVISASRTNSDIIIELGDDGRGFDLKAIHDKAVAMGKITPDATLSNEELADLVFLPGLSTAKKITGLSGRGVGMEIVRESIDSLRGKVDIRTVEGKGSTVRMRFPLDGRRHGRDDGASREKHPRHAGVAGAGMFPRPGVGYRHHRRPGHHRHHPWRHPAGPVPRPGVRHRRRGGTAGGRRSRRCGNGRDAGGGPRRRNARVVPGGYPVPRRPAGPIGTGGRRRRAAGRLHRPRYRDDEIDGTRLHHRHQGL